MDVPCVKLAAQKLQETNWLYGSIDLACIICGKVVDSVDAAKKTMGIVNDATSHVIEKASNEDMAGLNRPRSTYR